MENKRAWVWSSIEPYWHSISPVWGRYGRHFPFMTRPAGMSGPSAVLQMWKP